MKRTYPKIKLTKRQLQELELTGCVIAGGRIVRTMAFIKRVSDGARVNIEKAAERVFA